MEGEKCGEMVYRGSTWHPRREPCGRKAWKDSRCKIHHPEAIKARKAKRGPSVWEQRVEKERRDREELATLRARVAELEGDRSEVCRHHAGMEGRMAVLSEEIENRVTYHAPSPGGVERHKALSEAAAAFMAVVESTVPEGREKSLAFTNIEQAKMWASAGVARNPATV